MGRLRIAAFCLAAATAGGCATTPAYHAPLPALDAGCVQGLTAVEALPLAYPTIVEQAPYREFAALAHCYIGEDGTPAAVALFDLSQVAAPAHINIAAALSTGGTFAAAVELLDARRQPVRRYGFDRFVRRGSQYSLDIFLNDPAQPPAYLMLLPDEASVGGSDVAVGSLYTPFAVPVGIGGVLMVQDGHETMAVRPFLAGGQVRIIAGPQQSAPMSGE